MLLDIVTSLDYERNLRKILEIIDLLAHIKD